MLDPDDPVTLRRISDLHRSQPTDATLKNLLGALNAKLEFCARLPVLAFTAFPRSHWPKAWSTNPLERVNKKIKRRARVVGIFPNQPAVIRLLGAILADMHDEWQVSDRRYLSEGSMAQLKPTSNNETVAAISAGD